MSAQRIVVMSVLGALAVALGVVASTPRALANDGGGGGGGASACPPNTKYDPATRTCVRAANSCKRGTVRDRKTGKCVKVRAFDGDCETRYEVARFYARDGRYEDAIALLEPIAHERDPRVLNMLGFSHRKLGAFDTGLAYYKKALEIDPTFNLAREYLGEGYVAIGRVDLAREQLALIGRNCGVGCKEYLELEKVIASAAKS